MGLAIAAVIVIGTWNLFRQSLHLLFDGVPEGVELAAVRELLTGLPGVTEVHDLHVWAMGTSETALTAHLVVTVERGDADNLLRAAADQLHQNFRIHHATLQLESAAFAQTCSVSTLNCQLTKA